MFLFWVQGELLAVHRDCTDDLSPFQFDEFAPCCHDGPPVGKTVLLIRLDNRALPIQTLDRHVKGLQKITACWGQRDLGGLRAKCGGQMNDASHQVQQGEEHC